MVDIIAKPVESEQKLDLNEPETLEEELVEYEEVEEEVEVEVEEEVEEEIEEEVGEEKEAEEEECVEANANHDGDEDMEVDEKDEDEMKRHAELLALPPHGSEVYVGGVPGNASEEDLKGFCESVGEVFQVRIMKSKDSSENKGYAFVTFRTKELANKATEDLNNTEFKGKKIKCSSSQAKHRLFIGNLPRDWKEDDLRQALSKVGPGVTGIKIIMHSGDSSQNRGYAFIEYYNTACAEYSKKQMSSKDFNLNENVPTVSWADPKSSESSSSHIKSVYVKNLPQSVTQDQLKKVFEPNGKITKVVLPPAKSGQENRFGFVHFAERSSALKALENSEKYEIDGQILGCSFAKPPGSDKQSDRGSSAQKAPPLLPNYPLGFNPFGGAYGTLPAGYAPPMAYGRAPNAGMAMVPMLLPDGRLGYVMPQPGPLAFGGGRSGNSGGGRQNIDQGRGRRFQPY